MSITVISKKGIWISDKFRRLVRQRIIKENETCKRDEFE